MKFLECRTTPDKKLQVLVELDLKELPQLFPGLIPPGHKSMTHRLKFQAKDSTLTKEEVDEAMEQINKVLIEKFGAVIR